MENIKKIISLIICVALFVSIPAATVSASDATEVIPSAEYRGLFSALGFELLPERSMVTRGQFVTNLIKLMGFNTYNSGRQTFGDVSTQDAQLYSALEYAVGIGAVAAGENFYPDRAITIAEALKMTVEALGYGKDARYRGGYPTGYYAVASSIDLNDGIDIDAEFTSETMYLLLGNAANIEIKTLSSCMADGEFVTYTLEKSVPLLEAYRNIVRAEGIITASESGYLYDSSLMYDTGMVMIDDVEYAVMKGVICPLGFYVNAYAQKIGNRYVIIYADISENNVVEISASSISNISETALNYYDANNRDKTVKITSETVVLYNGKSLENYSDSDILIGDGYIEAVDNDTDGYADVLCVWEAKYLVVDYVNIYSNEYDYVFYDKNRKNNIFITSDTNYTSNAALDSVLKGAVIEAYVSKDETFVRLDVLSKTVSGSISEFGSNGEIYVDGKCYETSEYFREFYASLAKNGKDITFVTDSFGKAVALTTVISSVMKYAYFDNMSDKAQGLDDRVILKLFTEDGEVITPKLADKVVVNETLKKACEWIATLNSVKGELIKYQLNGKGEINKINIQTSEGIYDASADGADALKRFRFSGDDSDTTVYYKKFGYIVPHFTLNSSTKIFKIVTSESDDEERFSLGTLSFLGNDAKIPANSIRAYNVAVTGMAGAVLYKTSEAASASLSVTSSSALVAECRLALVDGETEAFKIKLYANGKFTDYYIKKDARFLSSLVFTDDGYPFNVGDVIRYAVDSKGYLLTAVKDFDGATQTLLYNADDNTELHYYFGQLYAEGDGSIAIKEADGNIVYIPCSLGDEGIVEDDKIYTQPRAKIASYLQVKEECHKILIRCRYSSATQVYVFK